MMETAIRLDADDDWRQRGHIKAKLIQGIHEDTLLLSPFPVSESPTVSCVTINLVLWYS